MMFAYIEPIRKQIANSSVGLSSIKVFAANLIGVALSFVLQVYVARILGVSDFGEYVYVLTVANFLSMALKGGMDLAAVKFIAKYEQEKKYKSAARYKFFSRTYLYVLGVFVFLSGHIYGMWFGDIANNNLYMLLLFSVVLAALQLECGFLQGQRQTFLSQLIQNVLRPVFVLFCLLLLRSGEVNLDAKVAVIVQSIVVGGFCLFLLLRSYNKHNMVASGPSKKLVKTWDKSWITTSYSLALVALFNLVVNQIDIVVVGYMMDPEQVGVYSASSRISSLVQFPIVALSLVVAPYISRFYSAGDMKALKTLIVKSSAMTTCISMLIITLLLLVSPYLLGFYGAEFISGQQALIILLLSKLVTAVGGFSGYLMTMTNHHKRAAVILGVTAVSSIMLSASLVARFGMEGAAMSVLLCSLLWVVLMSYSVYKALKITPFFVQINR